MAALDAAFGKMIEEQAEAAKANQLPPLDVLPPMVVRAGYRAQRQSQDLTAPKDVTAQDLTPTEHVRMQAACSVMSTVRSRKR